MYGDLSGPQQYYWNMGPHRNLIEGPAKKCLSIHQLLHFFNIKSKGNTLEPYATQFECIVPLLEPGSSLAGIFVAVALHLWMEISQEVEFYGSWRFEP